jgi:ubiquinone/menaquinone biosynthesis C-methylase UbiE
METKWLILTALVFVIVIAAGALVWRFGFYVAPYAWTGEPARLRDVLGIKPGSRVADIGAGDGALAIEMARFVGANGTVYATDISSESRTDIAERSSREQLPQVQVVAGAADGTNLPERCCDAIYLRAVFHHIKNQRAFARAIGAGVQPGGRVAIIDFPPGALWFHGEDHGVTAETIIAAFESAGMTLTQRIENWGGGMFLLRFEQVAAHKPTPPSSR